MSTAEFKFDLGSKVRDKVTGFVGVIQVRSEWLYGCRRYSVAPLELKDGRPQDGVGFDEDGLQLVEEPAEVQVTKATGGDAPGERRPSDASTRR